MVACMCEEPQGYLAVSRVNCSDRARCVEVGDFLHLPHDLLLFDALNAGALKQFRVRVRGRTDVVVILYILGGKIVFCGVVKVFHLDRVCVR